MIAAVELVLGVVRLVLVNAEKRPGGGEVPKGRGKGSEKGHRTGGSLEKKV